MVHTLTACLRQAVLNAWSMPIHKVPAARNAAGMLPRRSAGGADAFRTWSKMVIKFFGMSGVEQKEMEDQRFLCAAPAGDAAKPCLALRAASYGQVA